jgi:hypothetical protein
LCCVAVTLGHEFWRDPRFIDEVSETVGSTDLTRTEATQLLMRETGDWLAGLWNNDSLSGFAERMGYHLRSNAGPAPQVLQSILPGHWVVRAAAFNAWLIDTISAALPSMHMPAQKLAVVGLSLVHGTGWMRDPQYGWIAQVVLTAPSPDALASAVSAFYSEIA